MHEARADRILVLDDDRDTRYLIAEALASEYDVLPVATARQALDACRARYFALALLDVRLPGTCGLALVPSFRQIDPGLGLVLMTAYADVNDAVRAMRDLGVLDYLQKPFAVRELRTRVREALARTDGERWLRCRDLFIDRRTRAVARNGVRLELTSGDVDLLVALASREGRVVRYEDLAREVWGCEPRRVDRELVRNAVSRLRRRLGDDPAAPCYIDTVRGVGYRVASGGNRADLCQDCDTHLAHLICN